MEDGVNANVQGMRGDTIMCRPRFSFKVVIMDTVVPSRFLYIKNTTSNMNHSFVNTKPFGMRSCPTFAICKRMFFSTSRIFFL